MWWLYIFGLYSKVKYACHRDTCYVKTDNPTSGPCKISSLNTLLASALFTLNRIFDTFFYEHHHHWWWPLTEKLSDDRVPAVPPREVEISFAFCANSACRTKREIKKINQCNLNNILSYIFVEFLTENILSTAKSEIVLFFKQLFVFILRQFHTWIWYTASLPSPTPPTGWTLSSQHYSLVFVSCFDPLRLDLLVWAQCIAFCRARHLSSGYTTKENDPHQPFIQLVREAQASWTPPPLMMGCWQAHLVQVAAVTMVPKCHRRVMPEDVWSRGFLHPSRQRVMGCCSHWVTVVCVCGRA